VKKKIRGRWERVIGRAACVRWGLVLVLCFRIPQKVVESLFTFQFNQKVTLLSTPHLPRKDAEHLFLAEEYPAGTSTPSHSLLHDEDGKK